MVISDVSVFLCSDKLLPLQLWDQDIAPLKRSLSSNSRRLSRISQLALVICLFFIIVHCRPTKIYIHVKKTISADFV